MGEKAVDKEATDLENCEKELAEAKAKVEELTKKQQSLKDEEKHAVEVAAAAKEEETALHKKEDEAMKVYAKAKEEHEEADKYAKKELDAEKTAEEKLARAADRLQKFRGSPSGERLHDQRDQ